MPDSLTLAPTHDPHVFVAPDGRRVSPPSDWACLPPGDAGLTRRVKAAGPSWQVVEKKGRKTFSRGLWAPRANIDAARVALDAERSTESYAKKRAADVARRERGHAAYALEFEAEVLAFLRFAPPWHALAKTLAHLVAVHATPVGSGTVARTERIPIEQRAEAALIAWMRHQTTSYDDMKIARVAGARREVRRELAQISRAVIDLHRSSMPHASRSCSLCTAVARASQEGASGDAATTSTLGQGPIAATTSALGQGAAAAARTSAPVQGASAAAARAPGQGGLADAMATRVPGSGASAAAGRAPVADPDDDVDIDAEPVRLSSTGPAPNLDDDSFLDSLDF